MTSQRKTAVEIEIETAAGFYRAIGELANVSRRFGTDLQRQAFDAEAELEKALKLELAAWNDEADKTEFPRLVLCAAAESWEPWARREKCDVYMVERPATGPAAGHETNRQILPDAGLCPSCTALKAAYTEASRGR